MTLFPRSQKNSVTLCLRAPAKLLNFNFLLEVMLCCSFHMFGRGQQPGSHHSVCVWLTVLSLTWERYLCPLWHHRGLFSKGGRTFLISGKFSNRRYGCRLVWLKKTFILTLHRSGDCWLSKCFSLKLQKSTDVIWKQCQNYKQSNLNA